MLKMEIRDVIGTDRGRVLRSPNRRYHFLLGERGKGVINLHLPNLPEKTSRLAVVRVLIKSSTSAASAASAVAALL